MTGRLHVRAAALVVAVGVLLATAAGATATAAAFKPQLTIGISQVGEIYDPTSVLPSTVSVVDANVFDWLWWHDKKGNLIKRLAIGYKVAPDGLSLAITLRPNVKFSSGDPFTAQDVVFSWNRLKANGFSDRIARTLTSWDVLDNTHLVAHFAKPEIGFVPSMGFPIVSQAYFNRVGDAAFKANPVGTGPYMIKDIAANQYVDLVQNPHYWGKKPQIVSARFQTITDDTARVAALKTGAADMVMQIPPQDAGAVAKTKGLKTATLVPAGSSVYIAFKATPGQASTPWSDPKVREAVALAIDRNAIVKQLLKGVPVSYPFLAPGDPGYDPTIKPYPYDPNQAKQLLAQAGYPNGFTTDLPYLNAAAGVSDTANAVALYLKQVGITVNPKPLNGQDFVNWVFGAAHDPKQDYIAIFLGAIAGKAEPATAMLNSFSSVTPFAWYHNNAANGLILQANATIDPNARAALIKQAENIIYNDYGFVKLWDTADVYGMKSCIGFTPSRSDFDILLLRDVTSTCTK
jgi:peptide/nickel transport system substrate-binding protein